MKLEIVVPSQTTSTEIQELAEMISAGLGGNPPASEISYSRMATDGYYLESDGSGEELLKAEAAVGEFTSRNGKSWHRLGNRPRGCTYPKPLRETAVAYEASSGGSMEDLVAQERRLNPSLRHHPLPRDIAGFPHY
jgi:hypothetical protein